MCDFVKASFLTCSIQKQMQECKHECTFTYLKLYDSLITQLLDEISKKHSGVLIIFISQELVPVFSSPSPAPCLLSSHLHDPPEVSFHTPCRLARVTWFPLCMSLCLKYTHCPLRLPGSPSCLFLPHLF